MHVTKGKKLYAIIHKKNDWKEGLDFITPENKFCQVGTWWYPKNKHLKAHKHINNPRTSEITQECVIVIQGKIKINLFDNKNRILFSDMLEKGEMVVSFEGGHSYDILENNTKVIECKNGPFISVEKDKIVIE